MIEETQGPICRASIPTLRWFTQALADAEEFAVRQHLLLLEMPSPLSARIDYRRLFIVSLGCHYHTLKSWSRQRRVVANAEVLPRGPNPRFVVTSLSAHNHPAQPLYEQIYCARGEMENRIKEQQLDLFADRTSTHTFRANQLRLSLTAVAYVLMEGLRRDGLKHTCLARATVGSLRLKLLKIGAQVTTSVRRIKVAMASGCPYQREFRLAWAQLPP